jgi:hypothetical protein
MHAQLLIQYYEGCAKKEKGNAGHKAPEDKEYPTHVCLRPEVPKAKQMPLCLYYTKPKHV